MRAVLLGLLVLAAMAVSAGNVGAVMPGRIYVTPIIGDGTAATRR